ncbi:MAG: radical SAM protein [Nitrospiraceae bacterium]|nr:MAG: radical SAM protein [Nitrospiraceae bacterium]
MNKIVFLQKEVEDKLGPMILTAYLKANGFDAEIIINPQRHIRELKKNPPAFIGMSLCSPSVNWVISTARYIRENLPGSKIVLGGPHPTFFPQIVEQPDIDIVCVGEGEKPLLQVLKNYDGSISSIKDVPNLWIKDGDTIIKNDVGQLLTEEELSQLPFADRSHYDAYPVLRNNPHKKVWTSRGCPFNCSYCFNHAYKKIYKGHGKIIRQRSVESVINEIKELKKYGWKTLEIIDDQFLLSKDWVREFCDKYTKEIARPFACISSAKQIDSEVVGMLKKAGCVIMYFAIESGVEKIRREIYNKPVTNNDIYRAADALHSHNVSFVTFNMVGLPDESLEDIYETVRINQSIKATYPVCSILQPYPGTHIAEIIRKQTGKDFGNKFTYSYFQSSIIDDPDKRRLFNNAQKLFGYFVKSDVKYDKFVRLVKHPVLHIDRLYPLVFYWNFGRDIKDRYGIGWLSLLRYWLYSKSK